MCQLKLAPPLFFILPGGIQLKKRKWKFRIAGGAVTLLGIYLMAVGYGETITLTIATVVLIFGIAIWSARFSATSS